MTLADARHGLEVQRDAGAAALLGPVRLLVTAMGNLILYRTVMTHGGLEVIGLWAMLNAAAAFVSLLDVGFSQVLTREIHVTDGPEASAEKLLDKRAAERVYRFFFWFVALPAAPLAAWLLPGVPYDRPRFSVALALIAWSSVVQMEGKLEAAILAAYQDNTHVQVVNSYAGAISLAVAIIGVYLNAPLEGYALGALFSAAMVRSSFRRRVAHRHLPAPRINPPSSALLRRAAALARRGGYFYSISIGSVLREPLFRVIISYFLGIRALGIYTIALRASVTTRDLVAGGFSVLYPAMASLHRSRNRDAIASMQVVSMVLLTVFGCAALGCLYGFAAPVLRLCLGSLPDGLVNAVRILVVWNLITLANVPFYYLLLASGHEKASSASLWAHTAAIALLWPLLLLQATSLDNVLIYWTATSLATQGIIFYHVEKRLGGFWSVLKTRPVSLALLFATAYLAVIVARVAMVREPSGTLNQFISLAKVILPATLIFMAAVIGVSWNTLSNFWTAKESGYGR